jgi:hypothetical protein
LQPSRSRRLKGWPALVVAAGAGALILGYSQVYGRGDFSYTVAVPAPVEVPPALAAGDETIGYR